MRPEGADGGGVRGTVSMPGDVVSAAGGAAPPLAGSAAGAAARHAPGANSNAQAHARWHRLARIAARWDGIGSQVPGSAGRVRVTPPRALHSCDKPRTDQCPVKTFQYRARNHADQVRGRVTASGNPFRAACSLTRPGEAKQALHPSSATVSCTQSPAKRTRLYWIGVPPVSTLSDSTCSTGRVLGWLSRRAVTELGMAAVMRDHFRV